MIEMSSINFIVLSIELSFEWARNRVSPQTEKLEPFTPSFELLPLNQKDLEPLTLYTTIK